jgi:membrane protein
MMNSGETRREAPHGHVWRRSLSAFPRVWKLLLRTRALGLAAEMSFWLFLSLLPLAAVAVYLAARLALHDWSLTAPLLASMPPDARSVLTTELGRVAAWNGGAVTPLAGALFLWTASTGLHSIFDGFEAQTGATRPWLKKRLIALGCCVFLSCAGAGVALLGSALAWGGRFVGRELTHGGALELLVQAVGGCGLLYLLVAALYLVGLPRAFRRTIPLAPGTALVVLLTLALGFGYRLYVSTMGNGGAYLAGLAAIGVTMTTVYLFSAAILVGLALNQVLGHPASR